MKKYTNVDLDDLFSEMFDEYATNLYTVFDELIKDVPVIEVNKLADIPEPLEIEQVYRLSEIPAVEVISRLSEDYYYGGYEVGIVAVKDHLFLAISCLSRPSAIVLPSALKPMTRRKLFQ